MVSFQYTLSWMVPVPKLSSARAAGEMAARVNTMAKAKNRVNAFFIVFLLSFLNAFSSTVEITPFVGRGLDPADPVPVFG